VKANFVDPDPGAGAGDGGFAMFVGRLSEEKGIRTLLAAWRELNGEYPLKIAGDGPLRPEVEAAARDVPGIEYLGRRPLAEVVEMLGHATMMIVPSQWYEGMPRVMVESLAKGTPIIASKLGTMAEMIEDGKTGWLFPAGDAAQLCATVRRALREAAPATIRDASRRAYESLYTAGANYDCLMGIYNSARQRRAGQHPAETPKCDLADVRTSGS